MLDAPSARIIIIRFDIIIRIDIIVMIDIIIIIRIDTITIHPCSAW